MPKLCVCISDGLFGTTVYTNGSLRYWFDRGRHEQTTGLSLYKYVPLSVLIPFRLAFPRSGGRVSLFVNSTTLFLDAVHR